VKGKLSMALVATLAVTMLLGARGSLVQAQPVATISLPSPGAATQLFPGCNNVSLTFPNGTASETVVQAVSPAGAVEAMWRFNAALSAFEGFSPAAPQASDLLNVNFLDAVWLCVAVSPDQVLPPSTATPVPQPTVTPVPAIPTPEPTVVQPQEMSLSEAISQGVVDAHITGVGASSGDAIMLGLTRRVPAEVHIDLQRGTELTSSGSGFQDMVVYRVKGSTSGQHSTTYLPTSTIVLSEGGEHWFLVEAYCLDTGLHNPEYGTSFSVAGSASSQVVAVLAAADRLTPEPSIGAIQLAVWAASEDPTAAEVTSTFSVDQQDFNQARSILVEAGIDPSSKRMFQ
jgi:hypothetical protein